MATDQQGQGPSVASAKTLIERNFRTVNISTSPTALADSECPQLENLMPYAPGNVAVVPGPLLVKNGPAGVSIARFWAFVFNTALYYVVQGTDGSIYIGPTTGGWTNLAVAGSTTVNGLHMARWSGADAQGNPDAVLWVDTVKGFGNLTLTAFNVLQAGLVGQCLTVYQGRVWIGSADEVLFSAPGSYNDFNAVDYAGSFKVNDPSFTGNVIALQATQNWLYIIGSGMMALNNVQVQSVAGSSTLVTTYYLTPLSSSISITNEQASVVLDNVLLVCSSGSMSAYYGLTGQPISQTMGTNFNGTQFLFLAQIYGKILAITSAGYVLMLNEKQWFTMLADATTWKGYAWINTPSNSQSSMPSITGFVTDGTNILQIGTDFTTARACTLVTKLYDAGNASINKQVLKMGIELFPNELLQPLPSSFSIVAKETLLGYVSESQTVNMLQSITRMVPQNMFLPTTVNMIDRYFSMEISLNVAPGISIGGCFFQFMDSTPWPNRNIVLKGQGGV